MIFENQAFAWFFFDGSFPLFRQLATKLSTMDTSDISELMLEAEFLWQEINVGDRIQIEQTLSELGIELLTPGREYMVLVKQKSDTGLQSFITESNVDGQLATIYPFNVCHYVNDGQYIIS